MAVGLWHRLDQAGRQLLPFAVTLLMMLAAMAAVPLPGYGAVAPMLTLMSVFYWAIHRPDLLRPFVVFCVGVVQDLLGGLPLGVTPLVFMAIYWLLITQRRFLLGNSFLLLWSGFAVVAGLAAALQWVAFSLMQVAVLDFAPAGFQALFAIAVFPAAAWLFMWLHRAFLS